MFRGWSRVRSRLPVCLLGHRPRIRRPAPAPAGSGRGCLLHQSAAKAGGRGQHGMRPGGSSSTLLGCHLPASLKACLSNNRCNQGFTALKDKGQGATAETVRARCY